MSEKLIIHEDEIILSYMSALAQTIKLWVESGQLERITPTVDKFTCIMSAYVQGMRATIIESLGGTVQREKRKEVK